MTFCSPQPPVLAVTPKHSRRTQTGAAGPNEVATGSFLTLIKNASNLKSHVSVALAMFQVSLGTRGCQTGTERECFHHPEKLLDSLGIECH